MCGYQGYEFGAGRYPDSLCIDGCLHDADKCDDSGNIYLNDDDIPCPICRRAEAIEWYAQQWHDADTTLKECRRKARLLVIDIRQNRGLSK